MSTKEKLKLLPKMSKNKNPTHRCLALVSSVCKRTQMK